MWNITRVLIALLNESEKKISVEEISILTNLTKKRVRSCLDYLKYKRWVKIEKTRPLGKPYLIGKHWINPTYLKKVISKLERLGEL